MGRSNQNPKPEMGLIRVALFQEEAGRSTGWVAKCLDYDLMAQGDTPQAAQDSFIRILEAHIALSVSRGEEPFACVSCAEPAAPAAPKAKKTVKGAFARKWEGLKVSYTRLSQPEIVNAFG